MNAKRMLGFEQVEPGLSSLSLLKRRFDLEICQLVMPNMISEMYSLSILNFYIDFVLEYPST